MPRAALKFDSDGNADGEGFTVKTIANCRIVFGTLPMQHMNLLTKGFSKRAQMDTNLARRLDALFVVGEPEDLKRLRQMDLLSGAKHQSEIDAAKAASLPDGVVDWLANGQRGSSSEAMCKRMFGLPHKAGDDHPCDPSDLNRCLMFLDAAGAHDKVPMMADVSPEWARLVERWAELVTLFKAEIALGTGKALKTYEMMREILGWGQARMKA